MTILLVVLGAIGLFLFWATRPVDHAAQERKSNERWERRRAQLIKEGLSPEDADSLVEAEIHAWANEG